MSIHEMVPELDKGKIIYQNKVKIENNMTLHELIIETKKNNARGLIEVLSLFMENKINYKPLPKIKGSYYSFPTRKDVKEFKRRGKKII